MSRLRTCVIVNPASANGATGRHWPELRAALDKVLESWDHQFTLAPGDASRLAREAVEGGYEMVVSVGGDGTNNEVVTGLCRPFGAEAGPGLLREGVVLGVVRAGTGGDFARLLGLSGRLPASVAHLAGEATRPCDLGWIDFVGHDGAETGRAFLNIASFGLSGQFDDKVNRTTKALGGTASFLIGTLRALAAYRPQGVRLVVDGEVLVDERMVTAAVANGQYFGGGMHFAPEARIDDGALDVVCQLRAGPREIASMRRLYDGSIFQWDAVRHRRGTQIEASPLTPEEAVLVDVDGEQPGRLPARFTILPGALSLKIA